MYKGNSHNADMENGSISHGSYDKILFLMHGRGGGVEKLLKTRNKGSRKRREQLKRT